MNSTGHYRSSSAKTIDLTKKRIDSYLSKNVKNRLINYKNKMKNKKGKINNNSSISTKEVFSKTTMDFYTKKNIIKNNYNRLTPSCLRRNKTKYGNFFIFGKRELAFHKSIREGRKVFKYHQSTMEDEGKKRMKKINSLYLTEAILKRNKTMLPLIDKEKWTFEENDMSIYNLNFNKEKTRNKYDIKVLKNIKLNKDKYKENKKKEDYYNSKQLIKKNDVISKNNFKEKSLNNYINNIKDYLIDKYTLDIKNEKYKVINEINTNKVEKLNDQNRDLKSNTILFQDDFYSTFNEYTKKFDKQRDIERQRNFAYLNQIYALQKKITILKNKINKYQNEKELLIREIFLLIRIKEKKLNLPEYYTEIISNNSTKEEIMERYKNLSEKEIDHVFEYKNNFDINEDEVVLEKLKRMENDDIELMNNYYKNRKQIYNLKQYKKQVEAEIKNDTINDIDNLIYIKEKVLENVIKKNKKLFKDKLFLVQKKEKKIKKRSKLYYKIEIIFKNLNEYKKIDFKFIEKYKEKGEITEEMQIIEMIIKIEKIIAYILEKNRNYLINNKEQMQELKNSLVKRKKIEKTNEQKRNIILKFEKERKKIFDKNNKILFLQKRKLSIFNVKDKKYGIKKSKSQQKIKIDKISDYLHDLKNED